MIEQKALRDSNNKEKELHIQKIENGNYLISAIEICLEENEGKVISMEFNTEDMKNIAREIVAATSDGFVTRRTKSRMFI